MRELRTGLWHWQAPHPDWSAGEPWERDVSSYALDDGERLVLFDPLAPPEELLARAGEREPVVVLTAPWHERDARRLVDGLGASIYAPRPDTAQDLMEKYGVTAERAGDGSPDLAWLRERGDARWYGAGDRLPFGVEAFAGREHNDLVLWIEPVQAVLSGDTLVDFGRGFEIPPDWLRDRVTREGVAAGLRPLLDRPVELVLPTHGRPTDRAALVRALA